MSYESWRITFQSSEQAARAAYDELATLRAELDGAVKSRNAAMLLYESARQSRDDLVMQQHEWQEALRTLDSERAANTQLTAHLAASEARAERYRSGMREMIDCRTCCNHTRDGCIQTALCVDADGYRRALPVRFWVATSSAALAEGEGKP